MFQLTKEESKSIWFQVETKYLANKKKEGNRNEFNNRKSCIL